MKTPPTPRGIHEKRWERGGHESDLMLSLLWITVERSFRGVS